MELLRETFSATDRHQIIISDILASKEWSSFDKAKMLGANALVFASDKPTSEMYSRAARGQYIYHFLHDSGLSKLETLKALAKYGAEDLTSAVFSDPLLDAEGRIRLVRSLAARNAEINSSLPVLVSQILVQDNKLNVMEKISQLQDWSRKYPGCAELADALHSQIKYARERGLAPKESTLSAIPRRTAAKTALNPAPSLETPTPEDLFLKNKITLDGLLADPWVARFGQADGLTTARKRTILKAFFYDLSEQAELHWLHRGHSFTYGGLKLQGPDRRVTFLQLVAQMALSYLEAETRFNRDQHLPWSARLKMGHIYQAFVGKETAWYVDAQGYTNGKSNGTGPFQLTAICVYALSLEKLDNINQKISSWGGQPFDNNLARYFDSKQNRWISLVQVQTSAPIKGRKGRIVGYKKIVMEPEQRPIPPLRGEFIVRGPSFRSTLTNPTEAIRVASAALIMYGAHPDMSYEDLERAAEKYNGNNRLYTTPEGQRMPVKKRYKKEIVRRTKMADLISSGDRKP